MAKNPGLGSSPQFKSADSSRALTADIAILVLGHKTSHMVACMLTGHIYKHPVLCTPRFP